MALFGDIGPAASGVASGLAILIVTFKFFSPRSHPSLIKVALFIGLSLFGLVLTGGAVMSFIDPPPVAPTKVAPVAAPGRPGG